MSTDRDVTRAVRSWLDEGVTTLPDRVLDAVLDQVPATHQRRSWWPARRFADMNIYAKLVAAAAAVLMVAVIGYQFLPARGGFGGQPSPSQALLARGTFVVKGGTVVLIANRAGTSINGTMTVTHDTGDFTVDLKCALTTADGRVLIGGDTTYSKSPYATKGARTTIVLKPGSPVHAEFEFEVSSLPSASCAAFLEEMSRETSATFIGDDGLEPIVGTVELHP